MLSRIFRPKRPSPSNERRPLLAAHSEVSPFGQTHAQHNNDYFQHRHRDGEDDEDDDDEDEASEDDEDDDTPLLPIFSAAHLDSIPVYNLTHALRLLIIKRCETTLSWDQIRSPQVSQFLIKPIQQQIQSSHLTRATIYALLANCLQFTKEAAINPGNAGVCKTRALLAELLAMRLLKEFSTRELIDCLAYDFDPLRGNAPPETNKAAVQLQKSATRDLGSRQGTVRTSTLELAIRAQAKRFIAHRLVVQHLEAVWAGNIVFHSAADNLHRYPIKPPSNKIRQYGSAYSSSDQVERGRRKSPQLQGEPIRRSVTLYNPAEASLFKLSRLRVPRYRQIFSTLSYAIMLCLFVAILVQHSVDITAAEVVFWFWSAGFMLDEIIGFTEQGFGLYIISVWNAFDLGILLLFMVYYVMRLYGIIISENHKHSIAGMAYDVLASTAILLFPRLFSYLDHYRYFSQLLIAFRMMALDLIAILILVAISCSGFFVAFTVAFGKTDLGGPSGVIYALFQIVMGFTPAAWTVWDQYNWIGKALLTIFLVICHFLVITILITVLTNSFMKVVQNANEEHQYLFAVNTLSMVKSDALFSYIAPSNILGWLFSPVRYVVPFRQYVVMNRTLIKITHFPILFIIFAYERLMLGHYAWEPEELVDRRDQRKSRKRAFSLHPVAGLLSPAAGVREPSIRTYYKDQALDEVFRHPFKGDTAIRKTESSTDRGHNVVDKWMSKVGAEGGARSPLEQPRSILEQLEGRRPQIRRAYTAQAAGKRRGVALVSRSRSVFSDPERVEPAMRKQPQPISEEDGEDESSEMTTTGDRPHTEAELGDDERATIAAEDLLTHSEDDSQEQNPTEQSPKIERTEKILGSDEKDPSTPTASKVYPSVVSGVSTPTVRRLADETRGLIRTQTWDLTTSPRASTKSAHGRQTSSTTIVYHPRESDRSSQSSSPAPQLRQRPKVQSRPSSGVPSNVDVAGTGRRPANVTVSRPRPPISNRALGKSTPNVQRFLELASRNKNRAPSMGAIALDLASNIGGDDHDHERSRRVMESFMNDETHFIGPLGAPVEYHRRESNAAEEQQRTSRIMLARMNTLESGFKDMMRELKDWKTAASSRGTSAGEGQGPSISVAERRIIRRLEKKKDGTGSPRPESSGALTRVGSSIGPSGLSEEFGVRFESPGPTVYEGNAAALAEKVPGGAQPGKMDQVHEQARTVSLVDSEMLPTVRRSF